jgi:hypothetical protein
MYGTVGKSGCVDYIILLIIGMTLPLYTISTIESLPRLLSTIYLAL